MKKYGFTYRRQKEEALADKLNDQLKNDLDCGMSEEELFSFAEVDTESAERGGYSNYSYWGSTLRAFFQNKAAVIFLIIMVRSLWQIKSNHTINLIKSENVGEKPSSLGRCSNVVEYKLVRAVLAVIFGKLHG